MSSPEYKAAEVPTMRYRVMAIIFFLLAVGGLFLGLLGRLGDKLEFFKLFAHSSVPLYGDLDLAGGTVGKLSFLNGSLIAYIWSVVRYFFINKGLVFTGLTTSQIVIEVLFLAQTALIVLAVVLSLALGITASVTKGKVARGCAMVSGYTVFAAYLWPLLSVLFFGMGTGSLQEGNFTLKFLNVSLTLDLPMLIIAGISFLILAVTAIARRKEVGFVNLVIFVLTVTVAVALVAIPDSVTYAMTALSLNGIKAVDAIAKGASLYSIAYLILIGALAFNIVFSIYRMNAKRFYIFDAVRYGVLFAAGIFVAVVHILRDPTVWEIGRWTFFKEHPIIAVLVLAGVTLAFALAVINVFLVIRRRKKRQEERVLAELSKDTIDKQDDPFETYASPAPAPAQNPYGAPYGNPYGAPGAPGAPAGTPPYGAPYGYGAPIIIQQAPATPPVVLLQFPADGGQPTYQTIVPPYYQPYQPYLPQQFAQAQPVQQVQQVPQAQPYVQVQQVPPMQQAQPAAETAYEEEYVQEDAPVQPAPAPQPQAQPAPQAQPQPSYEDKVVEESPFAQEMIALAQQSSQPQEAPAPQPQLQPAPAAAPVRKVSAPAANEPFDPFVSRLEDGLREEFCTVFVEQRYGSFGVPAYQLGGENEGFFNAVFENLGKFREKVSTKLLMKIYDRAGQ